MVLFVVETVFSVELVHHFDIDKHHNDKDHDGALHGKPEAEREAGEFDLVQRINHQNRTNKANDEPYAYEDNQVFQIGFPVGFSFAFFHMPSMEL